MPTVLPDLFLLLTSVAVTVGLFFWIEHRWPATARMRHNDIIGWQINILGTIYAIVVGFMLANTWSTFQAARQNAGAEATSLVNLARLARGLPQPQGARLQQLTQQYVAAVITQEWPAMQQSRFAPATHLAIRSMWDTLNSVQPVTPAQQNALAQCSAAMINVTDHRRQRRIEMSDSLPGILWVVLDSGGALLLLCCCLFGSQQIRLHLFLMVVLSFLLTLLLLSIAAIDRPFQGWLHVPVEAFQGASTTLDQLDKGD